jgi:hypothetical protein
MKVMVEVDNGNQLSGVFKFFGNPTKKSRTENKKNDLAAVLTAKYKIQTIP